jgi:hypothetical protein
MLEATGTLMNLSTLCQWRDHPHILLVFFLSFVETMFSRR